MSDDEWRNRSAEEVRALSRKHTFFNWNVQGPYQPKVIARSQGVYFWDAEGNRYLDMTSQLMCMNIGHQHPKVIQAIADQAQELCYASAMFTHAARAELGRKLAEIAPGTLNKAFFTTGGAEAVEVAMKLAKLYTGRHKLISRYRSYHGSTHGASSLSGESRRWAVEPGVPGIFFAPAPYCYRCDLGRTPQSCDVDCARYIGRMIEYEGPENVAGVVIEAVVGANGVLIPRRDEYLPLLRRLCDDYGVLLIADEIMSGLGRCGEWFAVDHWGVVPDIVMVAKGLASAHMPIGAVLVSDAIGRHFDENRFWSGLTYSAHPISCAAAIATLKVYEEEGLIENARRLGPILSGGLLELQKRHPSVGDVRGLGLFHFIELVKDRQTKQPFGPYSTRVIAAKGEVDDLQRELMARGVYHLTNPQGLPVAPPLCISEEQLMEWLKVMDECITLTTDRAYVGK